MRKTRKERSVILGARASKNAARRARHDAGLASLGVIDPHYYVGSPAAAMVKNAPLRAANKQTSLSTFGKFK